MVTLICWIRFNSINPHIVFSYLRCSLADRNYAMLMSMLIPNSLLSDFNFNEPLMF